MRFVKVNYYLNSKFFVEDHAYKQMILKSLKVIKKDVKINDVKIFGDEKNNSFAISIDLEKNSKISYLKIVKQIQEELEEKSQLLINAKPSNIEIRIGENNGYKSTCN